MSKTLFFLFIILISHLYQAQKPVMLKWQEKPVIDIEYNSDGIFFATLCSDKTISIWNAITYELVKKLDDKRDGDVSINFSPNGNYIVSGNWDNSVKIWDIKKGIVHRRLLGHSKSVRSVVFHPSGNFVASAGWDTDIRIWYAPTGITLKVLKGHTQCVRSLCFSPCGKYLASGGNDLNVKIWDIKTGLEVLNLTGNKYPIEQLSYSPDGNFIATCSNGNNIIIWDIQTGKVDRLLKGHTSGVYDIKFSPDGKYLASGSNDKTAKIWEVETRKCIKTFSGYNHSVKSVNFSPNGKQLATVSSDRSIRVWDISELNIGHAQVRTSIYNALIENTNIFEWIQPKDSILEYYDRHLSLSAILSNDVELENIKLYINKEEYMEFDGYKKFVKPPIVNQSMDLQHTQIEYKIYLHPGENEIQIYAENSDATKFAFSKPLNISYFDISEQAEHSDLHVVLLNIPEYSDKKLNKDYHPNNFEKIKNIFFNQDGVLHRNTMFYDFTSVESTSANEIIQLIENMPKKVKENDHLYFFISGITIKTDEGKQYLIASDFNKKDPKNTLIDLKLLSHKISFIPGHACIFYDNTNHLSKKYNDLYPSNNNSIFQYLKEGIIQKNNYSLMLIEGSDPGKTFDIITHGFHIDNDLNKNSAIDIEELYYFIKQLNNTSFINKGRKIPLFYYSKSE